MYKILSDLLSDKKGGVVFSCFGVWHWIYIAAILGAIVAVVLVIRKKSDAVKRRAVDISINCAFGLDILDFFLMPFAYGGIDLEKLPFHACTAMCVACFLSRRNRFFGRFRSQLALLGLVSNLIYVIYPAGIMWYAVHPLSYRTVQTLIFHGLMTAYGVFALALDDIKLEWKGFGKDVAVVVAMALWALLGNTLYNGTSGEYSHKFNWFFVLQDPFYILPKNIAPFVMPFVVVATFSFAIFLVYCIYFALRQGFVRKHQFDANK